jgi:hypothetical protein
MWVRFFLIEIGAVHESGIGPSRHFAHAKSPGRFRRKADINWRAGLVGSGANDPTPTSASRLRPASDLTLVP